VYHKAALPRRPQSSAAMINGPALSMIVPTYNERDRLEQLVDGACAVFQRCSLPAELVIVDDNSPDGTGAIAEALSARYPLRVVHRAGKLGLGTAVMDGFRVAGANVLGVMDADLSHPPDLVPAMFAVLGSTSSDMVIGSRYIPGGGSSNWSAARLLMSRFACLLAAPVTPVRDATSGFFLVRREAIEGVTIAAGGFKICLELLVRGRIRAVAEVPYVFVGRTAGESKMNLREATGFVKQLRDLGRVRLAKNALPRPRYHRVPPEHLRDAFPAASAPR
jgi:dolichol-phosphate mannosyltransferase